MLERKPNESELDFIKRIVYGKLVDKVIEQDFSELSELVFGEGNKFSSDETRKRFYGIKAVLDVIGDMKLNNVTDEDVLNELELKRIEIQKERYKNLDIKREINRAVRETSRMELVKEIIQNSVASIEPLKVRELKTSKNNKEGLLILSDFHVGLATSNYWNEFNNNVLHERVEYLLNKTIEYTLSNNIDKLHVFINGDIINGLLHLTARIANTEDTIKQVKHASEILSDFIVKLYSETDYNIVIYFTNGNHSRVVANKKDSLEEENFEYLIRWYMEAKLSQLENVKFHNNKFDDNIIDANICGHVVYAVHGDKDKPSSVIQDLSLMTKVIPYMVCMSHYHHNYENEIHGIDIVMNGTLSGVDNYAKNLRLTSKPMQKLMIFNGNGRECTYNITLDRL